MDVPFEHFFVGFPTLKYLVVFLLSFVEGPIAMVASAMFYRLGAFSFFPLYFTLVLGDFTSDIGWYFVGKYGARKFVDRWGKYFSITPEAVEKLEKLFEKHDDKILFISKITMGFGFALATLMAAGMAKVPLKRYAFYNFVGGFIWTGILMSVGYFFGHVYTLLDKGFKTAFLVFVVVFVLAAFYGLGKYFKGRFLKENA
jgi:membrane protein DedA with SNARE-associated domain